jgi:hypothetical protein
MRSRERIAPIAAALSAVSTVLCCLPLGFVGALGVAGLSAAMFEYRLWLIGASMALLALGFVQVYRGSAQCQRRSWVSVALLWASAIFMGVVFLMPQLVATLVADWLG